MSRHGFTLVELLIVVGVIAVLAGIAAVAVRGPIDHARVNNAMSTLQRTIQDARRQAKRTNQDVEVQLASSGGKWKLSVGPTVTFPGGASVTYLPSSLSVTSVTPSNTLTFASPFGTYSGPQVSITLAANRASETAIVTGVLARMVVKQ